MKPIEELLQLACEGAVCRVVREEPEYKKETIREIQSQIGYVLGLFRQAGLTISIEEENVQ